MRQKVIQVIMVHATGTDFQARCLGKMFIFEIAIQPFTDSKNGPG